MLQVYNNLVIIVVMLAKAGIQELKTMFSLIQNLILRIRHWKIVGYVSDIDKFQKEWDAKHPKTASQLAEIKKYKRIFALRDHSVEENKT